MKILLVIDMQKDFIDGSLGTREAEAILCQRFSKRWIHLKEDTGDQGHPMGRIYLSTAEGRKLPVPHCIKGSEGWQLHPEIAKRLTEEPIDKPSFGSVLLPDILQGIQNEEPIESIK